MSPFEEFLAHYQSHSARTQTVYQCWMRRFAQYCRDHNIDPLHCRRDQVEFYFQGLLWRTGRQGLFGVNTLYVAQRTVSRFYWWALKRGLIDEHPYPDLMRRPPQPPKQILSEDELMSLFNLPDLGDPIGVRDLLLLESIYELGWDFNRCIHQGLDWDESLEPVKSSWRLYCDKARPLLALSNATTLIVSRRGKPFLTPEGVRQALRPYQQALKLNYGFVLILHRTREDLTERGVRRRLPLNI